MIFNRGEGLKHFPISHYTQIHNYHLYSNFMTSPVKSNNIFLSSSSIKGDDLRQRTNLTTNM